MIQVLMRAFRVLEAVSHAPERVWQLRELAEIAGVKPDTCFHIVRTMCSLGWLESPGPRKGYRLGPELNELCGGVIYRFELATHAKLQLRAFADRFRIPVMLAGINGSRRYIICREDHEPVYHRPQMRFGDLYPTATGRLLLAYCTPEQVFRVVSSLGLPSAQSWRAAQSRSALAAELERIRALPHLLVTEHPSNMAQIAFPVFEKKEMMKIALGTYLPLWRFEGSTKRAILEELDFISATLSRWLQSRS